EDVSLAATGAGTLSLNGGVTGNTHSLTLSAPTAVNLGDGTGADDLTGLTTLDVTGATALKASAITTSGTQRYRSAVTLLENSAPNTTKSLSGSTITFDNTLNATTKGKEGLAVTGALVLNNTVGGTTELGTVTVSGTTTFNAGATSVKTDNTGGGTGNQTYSGAVTLNEDVSLSGVGLTFSDTVAGSARNLTLDGRTGDIGFGGAVGTGLSPLGSLLINGARHVGINGAINASGVRQVTGTGTTTVNAAVTTTSGGTGIELVNNSLTLTANGALTSNGKDVVLGADTSISLSSGSVTAGAGTVTVGNNTSGGDISFGSGSGLVVLASDLNAIASASAIRLGNANTRDIAIAATLAPANSSSVALVASRNITQTAAVNTGNLRIQAGGDVTLTGFANNVSTLSARMTGANKTLALKTSGALNIGTVDGVAGINTSPGGGAAGATSGNLDLNVAGALTQSSSVVANTLKAVTTAGAITLSHTANDILVLDANASAGLTFYDMNGYKVVAASLNGLDFSSGGDIAFEAPIGGSLNIDAGAGDLRIDLSGGGGNIIVSGPGTLKGANITLKTSTNNDISFTGGTTAGQSNDISVIATGKLTLSTRNLTVAGGTSTATAGQTLKNDAILQASDMDIKTSGDFTIKGGTAIATSSTAGGDSKSQANAFVKTSSLTIDIGQDLILKGGDVQLNSSAGANAKADASAIFLVSGAKTVKVGRDFVLAGGTSSSVAGATNSGSALAIFDPEVPMNIETGGSLVLIGGTAISSVVSSASIQNGGPINIKVGGNGTYTDTIRNTGNYFAGIILLGGGGSGLFNLNAEAVNGHENPIIYTLTNGGRYTVETALVGGDAFIKSRQPIGFDDSLMGYILFASNSETLTKGKRTQTDQATGERPKKAGQCK
ncbi:MAG: hypothetical protein OEL88_14055, partial [Sterolibacteriaceae bacterium MAG5]|nr:hypothetical protein [Candidatus Nitricoxidireducens bremensis]